jgi:ABC-2 type transport system permease protein
VLANPFTKALWDARRSLPGWTLAVAAVAALYGAFWPSMQTPSMADAMASMPAGLMEALNYDDLTTAAGYLGGSVYGLLVPLLLTVFAIGTGTRAVAGDEEAGRLDLLLAHPVSRTRFAVQRFAALLVGVVLIAVAVFLVMIAMAGPLGFDGVTVGEFAAMTLHLTLLGAVFGALAFGIGASLGDKSRTTAVSAGIAVLAYLAATFLPQVDRLEWVRNLSPFYWYNGEDPLANGVQWGHVALLAATATALAGAGLWRLNHRDIST